MRTAGWFVLAFCAGSLPALEAHGQPDGGGDSGPGTCVDTRFEGDELCIPPPEQGLQLHYGPTDYDDPAETRKFEIPPGEAGERCFYLKTPNPSDVASRRFQFRSRPGALRTSAWLLKASVPDSVGLEACNDALFLAGERLLISSQIALDFAFDTGAPENEKIAYPIPAGTQAAVRVDYVNTSNAPLLAEVWLNVLPAPFDDIQALSSVHWRGRGPPVPPATRQAHDFRCRAGQDLRIVQLGALMSPWVASLSARVERTGERELVYETYDWAAPPLLRYDSVSVNEPPDPTQGRSGGSSGVLSLTAGDVLEWTCEIDNLTSEVLTYDSPSPDERIVCDLFGFATAANGVDWECTFPTEPPDSGAVPDSGTADSGAGTGGTAEAGASGATGGSAGTAATSGTGGSSSLPDASRIVGNDAPDGGGCGCRLPRGERRSFPAMVGLVFALVSWRRMR